VADQLNVNRDTFSKAIHARRLHTKLQKKDQTFLSCKNEGSGQDNIAPMGMGSENTGACQSTSVGQAEEPVAPDFQAVHEIPISGVLFAFSVLLVAFARSSVLNIGMDA